MSLNAAVAGAAVAGLPFSDQQIAVRRPGDALTVESATYLVEIEAYQGTAIETATPPPVVAGFAVAGLPFGTEALGADTTLLVSDDNWIGTPDDAEAPNIEYRGVLAEVPDWEVRAPIQPSDPRSAGRSFGSIEFLNLYGELDAWPELYAPYGRRVQVWRGPRVVQPEARLPQRDEFALLFSTTSASFEADERLLRLTLGGTRVKLGAQLQQATFGGTGGADGDSELEGLLKPQTFGFKRNVAPLQVNAANLVYAVHDRRIEAISAVRDRGAPLTATSDYADYAALIGASLSAGQYATCLALGLFRVHSLNDGSLLTCDVQGDADPSYVSNHGSIVRRIFQRADIRPQEVDDASLVAWPDGTAGTHLPAVERGRGAPTIRQVVDQAAASCQGWIDEDAAGRLIFRRLVAPTFARVTDTLAAEDIRGDIEEEPWPLPIASQRVAYRVLQTVQDDFVGADDAERAERRALYGQAQREVSAVAAEINTRYPNLSPPDTLVSWFDEETDAQALADHVADLHGADRRAFRIPVGPQVGRFEPYQIVSVTYPRGPFAGGKPMAVVGLAFARGELIVWG